MTLSFSLSTIYPSNTNLSIALRSVPRTYIHNSLLLSEHSSHTTTLLLNVTISEMHKIGFSSTSEKIVRSSCLSFSKITKSSLISVILSGEMGSTKDLLVSQL